MRDIESGKRMTDRKRIPQGEWRRVVDSVRSIRRAQPHADGQGAPFPRAPYPSHIAWEC